MRSLVKSLRLQEHEPGRRKTNSILGCIRQNIANRSREVILSLCLVLGRTHLEFWIQFLAAQYVRNVGIMESLVKGHQDGKRVGAPLQ